jgi:DNA-binding transcriptional ArsR family regulator
MGERDVVIQSDEPQTEPDYEVDVHGGGLLLLPSAFIWPFVATVFRSPSEPAVAYPSRGIGTLWQVESAAGSDALAALIGRTRAGLLAILDAPLSTSEVAQRSGLSIGGVSRHLAVLRDSGLVTSQRRGHAIVHYPTPLGLSLLEADGDAPFAAAG